MPGCLVSSLETIQVDKFMGHKEIVDLVIDFLKNSLVLKKLILYCQDLDSGQVEKLHTQLHMLTPGSKTCHIHFFRYPFLPQPPVSMSDFIVSPPFINEF